MSDAAEPRPTFRLSRAFALDLVTSYGVNFARAGSMLAIVALLGHRTSTGYLAAFLFLRSTLGLINNLFAGAQPAALAALRHRAPTVAHDVPTAPPESIDGPTTTVSVDATDEQPRGRAAAAPPGDPPPQGWDALLLGSVLPAALAYGVVVLCAPLLTDACASLLPASRAYELTGFSILFALGLLARVASDSAGGVLQARRLLWLDNVLVAAAEVLWVGLAFAGARNAWAVTFGNVADAFAWSGALLFLCRWCVAGVLMIDLRRFSTHFRFDVAWRFLSVGGLLAFASLGDFLYAPTSNLIISRMLDPILIADYGPALQVDAVLILGVSGLAGVMLPRVVAWHERGDLARLRRAYLAASICGTLLLAGGAGIVLAFSGPVLNAWLGDVPPGTRAILPWVLAHCVIGGCGGIGRAVLLGIGRFKAWTLASLGGGLMNASLAVTFVSFGWGLRGIVLATIVTVTLRNAVWMPWYILRTLRAEGARRTP